MFVRWITVIEILIIIIGRFANRNTSRITSRKFQPQFLFRTHSWKVFSPLTKSCSIDGWILVHCCSWYVRSLGRLRLFWKNRNKRIVTSYESISGFIWFSYYKKTENSYRSTVFAMLNLSDRSPIRSTRVDSVSVVLYLHDSGLSHSYYT